MDISSNFIAVLGYLIATATIGNAITRALGFVYRNSRIREAGDALSLAVAGTITVTADHVAITHGPNNLAHPERAVVYGVGWVILIVAGSLVAARLFPDADNPPDAEVGRSTPVRAEGSCETNARRRRHLIALTTAVITTALACAVHRLFCGKRP